MKKLSFSIVLALLAGATSVFAQGPIQVVNQGTNLAIIASSDTTATPIIANVYEGQNYTMANGSGGTNSFITAVPASSSVIIFTNSAGGVSIIQRPTSAPIGYRIAATIFNPWTNSIGIKLSASYPVGATPDRILLSSNSASIYFEDGYNGAISARSLTTDGGGSITYSDWGN